MTKPSPILVVAEESGLREALRQALAPVFEVIAVTGGTEAETVLAGTAGAMVAVVLCAPRVGGESGVSLLARLRTLWPDPVRLLLAGSLAAEEILAGLDQAGLYRVVAEPWQPDRLLATVAEAAWLFQRLTPANDTRPPPDTALPRPLAAPRPQDGFAPIVHAASSPVAKVIEMARRAAAYDISVLITGASGTGKELLARAIHQGSTRANRPFVVENCGALPEHLLESELFGSKKGSYTGAYQDRIGLFEVADGGTLFLDEIGETSPAFQVKLLRALQEGEIRPVGAQRPRRVDVRVISATNRDLDGEVAAGRFRRDLYYRLAAFPIHIPPLAERRMDITPIAERILAQVNHAFHRAVPGFHPDTLRRMQAYGWPGNVRELHNEIQRMVALSDANQPLGPHLLSPRLVLPPATTVAGHTLKDRVEALEKTEIEDALARSKGNISHAAELLGLSRVGLRAKIDRYHLRRDDGEEGYAPEQIN